MILDTFSILETLQNHLFHYPGMMETLEKMKPEITLPEDLRIDAFIPLAKMLALS